MTNGAKQAAPARGLLIAWKPVRNPAEGDPRAATRLVDDFANLPWRRSRALRAQHRNVSFLPRPCQQSIPNNLTAGGNTFIAALKASASRSAFRRVGIADTRLGERNCLCVIPKVGQQVQFAEIVAFLKDRVADYKLPEILIQVDELHLTGTGKIRRHVFRKQVEKRLGERQ